MSEELGNDPALIAEFLTESRELLQRLDDDLVTLESTPGDVDLVNRLFRALHTIKGTSSFLGFTQLVEITHAAEDVLNLLRKGEVTVSRDLIDALLLSADKVKSLLDDVAENKSEHHELQPIIQKLRNLQKPAELTVESLAPKLGQVLLAEDQITYPELESG